MNVHGETIAEPVEPSTNWAALTSPSVDLLAHPGLMTPDEARLASEPGTWVETSARRGHSLVNVHMPQLASAHCAFMILNSDAYEPTDLLTPEMPRKIAAGAALSNDETRGLFTVNRKPLLEKLGIPFPAITR